MPNLFVFVFVFVFVFLTLTNSWRFGRSPIEDSKDTRAQKTFVDRVVESKVKSQVATQLAPSKNFAGIGSTKQRKHSVTSQLRCMRLGTAATAPAPGAAALMNCTNRDHNHAIDRDEMGTAMPIHEGSAARRSFAKPIGWSAMPVGVPRCGDRCGDVANCSQDVVEGEYMWKIEGISWLATALEQTDQDCVSSANFSVGRDIFL